MMDLNLTFKISIFCGSKRIINFKIIDRKLYRKPYEKLQRIQVRIMIFFDVNSFPHNFLYIFLHNFLYSFLDGIF